MAAPGHGHRGKKGAARTSAAVVDDHPDFAWHAWVKGLDPLKRGIQKNYRPRGLWALIPQLFIYPWL